MCAQRIAMHSGGADEKANALREKIINAPDSTLFLGKVYYVAANGDDNNDGLSPEKAIASYHKVNELPLCEGDAVLFERGSVFRATNKIELVNGIYYGAYGEGEKPRIYGSFRDYADPAIWSETERGIWRTQLCADEQAGMVNFNNDECIGVWQEKLEDLSEDGDFYHDKENGVLYLCSDKGNPGEAYDNIEIATIMILMHAMRPTPAKDITVENLCFKYATFGPIDIGLAQNVHILNCEMGWHGGRVFCKNENGVVRYGNAMEFWHRAKNVTIENCWVYQIFDAAMTFQGHYNRTQAQFSDICFKNNLIEYCSMNIEYWAGTPEDEKTPYIADISVKGNIIRFGGYGWGGIQRCDKGGQGMILGWNYSYDDMHNFVITENILDCADCYMIHLVLPKEQEGLIVHGNTYFQKETSGNNEFVQVVKGVDIVAHDQQNLEDAILKFDSSPAMVKWLSE